MRSYTPDCNGGGRTHGVRPVPRRGPRTGLRKGLLTSLAVRVRTRSRSSTSCLNVGLCEGTACQQSRIIMYLGTTGVLVSGHWKGEVHGHAPDSFNRRDGGRPGVTKAHPNVPSTAIGGWG